jgi:hypothetical protein
LPHIQLFLGEDVLKALVVGVDLTMIPHKVVSPCFEGMDNSGKLKVMGRVVQLVRAHLMG